MINAQVVDLSRQSSRLIADAAPRSIDDVRALPSLIEFSDDMRKQQNELKRFLRAHLYQHYRVNRMSAKARLIIRELFAVFIEDPALMPDEFRAYAEKDQPRAVADYIAGMTDRYAIREYRRLFAIEEQSL